MQETISSSGHFGDVRPDDERLLASVCNRLDKAEQTADDIWRSGWAVDKKTEACRKAPAFNVEGAVAVPNDGREAVWVGLRSPLLSGPSEGTENDMAILLRLQCPDCDRFEFGAVALVDLDGFGIRGLTFSEGSVFGIAGPSGYGKNDKFKAWKFLGDELQPEAVITPKILASLNAQASPEGLVVIGSTSHVVFDGDRDARTCKNSAGYWTLSLPHWSERLRYTVAHHLLCEFVSGCRPQCSAKSFLVGRKPVYFLRSRLALPGRGGTYGHSPGLYESSKASILASHVLPDRPSRQHDHNGACGCSQRSLLCRLCLAQRASFQANGP